MTVIILAGMESAPSEDNLDAKGGNNSNPALNMLVTSGRAYSSEDLRSMGAPMSGPSGTPLPMVDTPVNTPDSSCSCP